MFFLIGCFDGTIHSNRVGDVGAIDLQPPCPIFTGIVDVKMCHCWSVSFVEHAPLQLVGCTRLEFLRRIKQKQAEVMHGLDPEPSEGLTLNFHQTTF